MIFAIFIVYLVFFILSNAISPFCVFYFDANSAFFAVGADVFNVGVKRSTVVQVLFFVFVFPSELYFDVSDGRNSTANDLVE